MIAVGTSPGLARPILLACALLSAGAGPLLPDGLGVRDPEFEKVPFAAWFAGHAAGRLKWSHRVLPVSLSEHQRFVVQMEIEVKGTELVKYERGGKFVFYFQLIDAARHIYQDHAFYDNREAENDMVATVTDHAFILPGDYSLSLAVFNTSTGEYGAQQENLHVAPMRFDPLPDLWRDLPAVDFVDAAERPDQWFLPKEKGRLNLAVVTRRAVRIEILANLAAPEPGRSSYRNPDSNLSKLVPLLKVLSLIKGPEITVNVSLLDIAERRVIFQQNEVGDLDWNAMRTALSNENAGLIDAGALGRREDSAAFLVGEVAKRLAPNAAAATVAIVLSDPIVFDTRQNPARVRIEASPDTRVLYVRTRGVPHLAAPVTPITNRRESSRNLPTQPIVGDESVDVLAHLMNVPGRRLFDVANPEQFRVSVAEILRELASL